MIKDFVIITEQNEEIFTLKLKNYMNQGFIVKHSNVSTVIDLRQRLSNIKGNNIIATYYAYMEKE